MSLLESVLRLRREVSAMYREKDKIRRSAVLQLWGSLSRLLNRIQFADPDPERGKRADVLNVLLMTAEASQGVMARKAVTDLEGPIHRYLGSLLQELRRGTLPGSEEEATQSMLRLEAALLAGLVTAGASELVVQLSERISRDGMGSLLLTDPFGDPSSDLPGCRGVQAALLEGLVEMMADREHEAKLCEQRAEEMRNRVKPAAPLQVTAASEGIMMNPGKVGETPEGDGYVWSRPGSKAVTAYVLRLPGLTEGLMLIGVSEMEGVTGDRLLREFVRRSARAASCGKNYHCLSYPGGFGSLAEAIGLKRCGEDAQRLQAVLSVGQQLRLCLPNGHKIGGLWTWQLLGEGGRAGHVLEVSPAPCLLPGCEQYGPLLPALESPCVESVAPRQRAAALRLQWRLLHRLRQRTAEELRERIRNGQRPLLGFPALTTTEIWQEAAEVALPSNMADRLMSDWKGDGGWFFEQESVEQTPRWRLREPDGELLLLDGARMSAYSSVRGGRRR